MERRATVVRIEGDFVFLKLDAASGGCGRCNEVGGCSTMVLGQLFGPACRLYKLPNTLSAQVGDEVALRMPHGVVWRAALLLYGLPLLSGLVGAGMGAARSDGWAVGGLLAGLLLGALAVVSLQKRLSGPGGQPVMVRLASGQGARVQFVKGVNQE